MNQRLLITLAIAVLLITGTVFAIRWAQGYRINFKNQKMEGNGLLVANSIPRGASIFINDKLETASDDTIHLAPENYKVRIEKDGYTPWEKQLKIEKELVTQTNARLFPVVPDLSSLTVNGAANTNPSPDGHTIAFQVATGSAKSKYGIWILNVNENPLRLGNGATQIVKDTPDLKFSQAKIFWHPNSNDLLAYFNDNLAYLLNSKVENKPQNMVNVALQLPLILEDWQRQLDLERSKKLIKMPVPIQEIATKSATLVYFSPNEEKILYVATQSAVIADHIIPPLPAVNSQKQSRSLEAGSIYVYDSKEDTNFMIASKAYDQKQLEQARILYTLPTFSLNEVGILPTASPLVTKKTVAVIKPKILDTLANIQAQYSPIHTPLIYQWFPDSYHLIATSKDSINILEYDGSNLTIVYSGIFLDQFAYPWPNGQKLILLTSLTTKPQTFANLYGLNLE